MDNIKEKKGGRLAESKRKEIDAACIPSF